MCGQRGLLADSDDQTFGMALSRQFRTHYDTIIAPLQAEVHQPHNTHVSRILWEREEGRNLEGSEGGGEKERFSKNGRMLEGEGGREGGRKETVMH